MIRTNQCYDKIVILHSPHIGCINQFNTIHTNMGSPHNVVDFILNFPRDPDLHRIGSCTILVKEVVGLNDYQMLYIIYLHP